MSLPYPHQGDKKHKKNNLYKILVLMSTSLGKAPSTLMYNVTFDLQDKCKSVGYTKTWSVRFV